MWIPLREATIDNGCMQVIPRSAVNGQLLEHCPGTAGGLGIPDHILPIEEVVALPMSPGSVLLMTQRTPHRSLTNRTESEVRLSLDLRYQAVGERTGRPAFDRAGFIARSQLHPESVLSNAVDWRDTWLEMRCALASSATHEFNRWKSATEACA